MIHSRRIAELEEQVTGLTSQVTILTAERDSAQTNLAAAQVRVTELEGAHATLAGQVTTLTTERDSARTDLAAAQTQITTLNTERSAEIERQVVERIAAAGVAPIARDPASTDGKDAHEPTRTSGLTGLEKARAALAAQGTPKKA